MAILTGDCLVVGHCGSDERLSRMESQFCGMVYRSFCRLHGCDRDEYKQQLGARFQSPEFALADSLQEHSATATADVSDSASDSAYSSHNHLSMTSNRLLNTNFFCGLVDERPMSDTMVHCRPKSVVIETSERTVECQGIVSGGEAHDSTSHPSQVTLVIRVM